jgi:subtilisin-like proprotein convertase family protein
MRLSRKPIRPLIIAPLAALAAAMAFPATPASAATASYSNTTPIVIPLVGKASPYPSQINVQGLSGRITDISVLLNRFSHFNPNDLDVLLEAPGGKTSVVMSDACGNAPLQNLGWIFTQGASEMTGTCPALIYGPTNGIQDIDDWPTAPRHFHDADFDQFIGGNPNGTWKLYVVDDRAGEIIPGKFSGGWSLTIATEPADVVVPGDNRTDGIASPYPATRTMSGLDGVIKDVDVSLGGVYHEQAFDLELLLLGPSGQNVMLMSAACGFDPVKGVSWRWDDEAAQEMPTSTCGTGRGRTFARDCSSALARIHRSAWPACVKRGRGPSGAWRRIGLWARSAGTGSVDASAEADRGVRAAAIAPGPAGSDRVVLGERGRAQAAAGSARMRVSALM